MPVRIKGLSLNSHGYYQWQPTSKGLPRGTPRPRPRQLSTRDRDEAIRLVLDLRGHRTDGSRGLRDWITVYRDEMVRSGQHRSETARGVGEILTKLGDWRGNINVDRISRSDAMDWISSLASPLRSHATIHRYMRIARALFNWLLERRVVQSNPFARLGLPAPSQSRRDQFCTPEQRDTLINACTRDDLRFVLMAGFWLGLRIKEIVNARWSWFDITSTHGVCTVRNEPTFTTKTGRERQVPMHPAFLEYIRQIIQHRPAADTWVIHPENQPQPKRALRWNPRLPFGLLARRTNLPWVTFHTMRHTFASLHAMAGTPEIKVRRWLGITQQTWERHYAGLSPDDRDIARI